MADVFDIAVIGGGPAGLSAVLTAKNRNKSVLLFEHLAFSPKLQKAHQIDNYLGLPNVTGAAMMDVFSQHALSREPVLVKEKVVNIFATNPNFMLVTGKETYQAKSVILATGLMMANLFDGEKELLGRGVSYCVTCDGMFYRGKNVAVVSYTAEAEEESNFLAEICQSVTYLPQYKGNYERLDKAIAVFAAKPQKVCGEEQVSELMTDQAALPIDGLFIMRESDPVESLLPELELDDKVVLVDRQMATNVPGVFAAGDCTGKPWQIAKAVGEGLVAALSAVSYLDGQKQERK
ncbi:MAG: NAD(P)/FAD-dependent oxidoreductase [Sporomusaceae bacterium]|nr:NAD(P)/FAD-dependent oxidoreductase [Sporomusaceae bacterium]